MDECTVLPGSFSPRFFGGFAWYVRRLLARDFNAVRLASGSRLALDAARSHDGPVIMLLTHASWWDPLVGLFLADRFMKGREGCAPMDAAMLRRLGLFRKLGLFGIDPDHPDAARAMREHVLTLMASQTRPTLWITPQGEFTDPRAPMKLRPGAASIAAACEKTLAIGVAVEYCFWLGRRPELLIRVLPVESPAKPSTPRWHAAMTEAMSRCASELAKSAMAREAAGFETLIGAEETGGFLSRLRGGGVSDAHRRREEKRS